MTSSTGTYDTRRYPLCAPWSGERGDEFAKRFLPSFLSGLMAKSDDFCTYEQQLAGECPGGIIPPTAAQLQANPQHVNLERPHLGNAAEQRKSETAFYNRDSAIISAFRTHMLNPMVQKRIDDIIGEGRDLGVENLRGSGEIAGETSRAYDDTFTLTYVSGRSVGRRT